MSYDVIVIGSGASGLIAAIQTAKNGKNTLLLEKLSNIGSKLKATGGGRCNLSNTLDNTTFINSFGKQGRFMTTALNHFDYQKLIEFFNTIGVDTHIPDGFRIFPTTHNSSTIIKALQNELLRLNIKILYNTTAKEILTQNNKVVGVKTDDTTFDTKNIILATGGLGYPQLGSTGDGHKIVEKLGHTITKLYPAMMPLHTKENWQGNCTANTIAKATIRVNLPDKKLKKLTATGDLIFTKNGLRGPVILDFAREITPYLDKYDEVPIVVNITKGMNEDDILRYIKEQTIANPNGTISEHLKKFIPQSIIDELSKISNINSNSTFKKIKGIDKNRFIKLLSSIPFTIIGHDGFNKAMITRGGIKLNEIDSNTMQSKLIDGLYFCGELVDLDGPCGGYNLQWAFSSGYLAGELL